MDLKDLVEAYLKDGFFTDEKATPRALEEMGEWLKEMSELAFAAANESHQ